MVVTTVLTETEVVAVIATAEITMAELHTQSIISCLNGIAIAPSFTFEIKLNQFNKNQFNTSLLIFYLFLFYMYEHSACLSGCVRCT